MTTTYLLMEKTYAGFDVPISEPVLSSADAARIEQECEKRNVSAKELMELRSAVDAEVKRRYPDISIDRDPSRWCSVMAEVANDLVPKDAVNAVLNGDYGPTYYVHQVPAV